MRHGSLFSGVGGFDLAAEWMGWENVFQVEKDAFCGRILQYYWPKARLYEDIKKFEAVEYRGGIDVLSGGFPCQPFSVAGKRRGTDDGRYLWPEMYRVVCAIRPRWVVAENVLGLLNWDRGMVFEQVLSDLERAGYKAWAYILPAAGVGAPHRRERIFFVAYANGFGDGSGAEAKEHGASEGIQSDVGVVGTGGAVADADNQGLEKWFSGEVGGVRSPAETRAGGAAIRGIATEDWQGFPVESPFCVGDDGFPGELDGITFSHWRSESLKAAGNAVVPQVVWRIFRTIEKMEEVWREGDH